MMNVKIKKLTPDAVIPTYANPGDAGLDITAVSVGLKGKQLICRTGISMEIPEGYFGLLFPRSSISKKALSLSNSVGVIDSSYRGEILVKFNVSDINNMYTCGDRVAQLVILPYPPVVLTEEHLLSDTQRGEGGFGSSGA